VIEVEQAIVTAQRALELHPFMRRLEGSTGTSDHCQTLAAQLTFWAMAFQDVIRMNAQRATSPTLAPMVRQHYSEDSGHDAWFWADAERLGAIQPPPWYFGASHAGVRELSYALLSEVFRAGSDEERLVLVLAIEGGAEVFFPRVVGYFERSVGSLALVYFADAHRQVDSGHDLFQNESAQTLAALSLSPEVRRRALELVGRVFEQFALLARHLEEQLQKLEARASGNAAAVSAAARTSR
jgi:hypothetical protein